jgi:hypothetical protein
MEQELKKPPALTTEQANELLNPKESSVSTFNTRMPKIGEMVIFFPNPDDSVARSNNNECCPAIVTRAWSSVCVNLKIIPDHGPMQDRGSVSHHTANPAGYHFKFMNEVYPETPHIRDVVFES